MDRIEDLNSVEICDVVMDLFPAYDTLTIKNRLLDGSYHIQTVGQKVQTVDFTCVCNHAGMLRLNSAEADVEPIKVYYDDDVYIGVIDQLGAWNEAVLGEKEDRYYSTRLRLVEVVT